MRFPKEFQVGSVMNRRPVRYEPCFLLAALPCCLPIPSAERRIGGEGGQRRGRHRSVVIYDIYLYEEKKKKRRKLGGRSRYL